METCIGVASTRGSVPSQGGGIGIRLRWGKRPVNLSPLAELGKTLTTANAGRCDEKKTQKPKFAPALGVCVCFFCLVRNYTTRPSS